MIYIVDTYAWIEYFIGSGKGAEFEKLLAIKNNKFITMECCISELAYYALRHNADGEYLLEIVRTNSITQPVLMKQWLEAAKTKIEMRKNMPHFGLIDAILLSKQRELKCKLISGDPHFKNLKNVVYVGD